MKTFTKIICACITGVALIAAAALPTYHTFSGYGNGSAGATVLMPADPNSQIRIVSMYYSDDQAGSFTFTTGGTAYSCVLTNPASFTTNAINSTNGLFVGNAILQHNGTCYTNAVASWGSATNVNGSGIITTNFFIVTSSGFAIGVSVGDNIWMMTNTASWYTAATTNQINGDDIYSGNYGTPVEIQLGLASATNRFYLVSAHYDSQSQP